MTRELRKLVNRVSGRLHESRTLADIYETMFGHGELVLAETNDGYRIKKQTYGEMKRRIEKFAAAMRESIGGEGGFVALEMENSPEWIVAFWGILMSGNKPYLVNCRHPLELASGSVRSLGCKYAVSNKIGALPCEYLIVTELEEKGETLGKLGVEYFADEIALSTSATSLKEVICFYTGKEIKSQLENVDYVLKNLDLVATHYNGSLKLLAFLPLYHIFGLIAIGLWFTLFGRTLVFLSDYSGDTILKTIRKHEVTHLIAVPMFWHEIERELTRKLAKMDEKTQQKFARGRKIALALQNIAPVKGAALSRKMLHEVTDKLFGPSVCFAITGGSFIRPQTLELMNSLGYSLRNGYGMSEIGIVSFEMRNPPKHIIKGSIGNPLPSVDFRINDRGTLEVKGTSTCARIMVDGVVKDMDEWFDTGDVMECIDGYYYIKGRVADTVIGENGENINPDVIEEKFTLPSVTRYSVLGLDSGDGVTKRLSMIAEVSKYLSPAKRMQVAEEIYRVNATLPTASAICDFYFTEDAIAPETAVKVGRQYLLKKIADGSIKLTSFAETKAKALACEGAEEFDVNSEIAKKVRSIIAECIGVEESAVTPDAHVMLELGGSSLQYFSLLKALEDSFPVGAFDDNSKYCYTLRTITEYVERNM